MKFKVINLARTPHRLYNFKVANPHFVFERFNAVDGTKLDRAQMVSEGLITEACAARYSPGALGVAMSHRELWKQCAADGVNYTILEDDAYLAANFNTAAAKWCSHNTGWDFIFWGANFDQRLEVQFSPGVASAEVWYNFTALQANIANIKNQTLQPSMFRTHWAVGLCCYTITPKTAAYLLDVIFPLRDYFDWRNNYGIDNSIIEELRNMQAFISLPPLALTLNDRSTSTVQVGAVPPRDG